MTIFANKDAAVGELRADRFVGVAREYFDPAELSDNYLHRQLMAAESEAEHKLRVFLEPVEMVPEDAEQAVVDALEAAGTRYKIEPAYDWDPSFFQGDRFGFIQTRERPIISIESLTFRYPFQQTNLYTIPIHWVRFDGKYGQIRIVPGGEHSTLPLNAWLLQVHGGGRAVPHMIQLRYRAGLADVRKDYPDLVSLILRMAVLRVISDQFLPQSGSVSGDGFSQSSSIDVAKWAEEIDRQLDALKSSIHGVAMTFV